MKKYKILLVPDAPNWAFDNIANAIIEHNPYPELIEYTKMYIKDKPFLKEFNELDYDLVYVFFEGEYVLGRNIVKGCYSQYWLENPKYTPQVLGRMFSDYAGVVFANDVLKEKILPHIDDETSIAVIHDAADEKKFYPKRISKEKNFTVLFVGNTLRPIKRFHEIIDICEQAKVQLIFAKDVPHDELVDYYNVAHLSINFSLAEGGPQTFLESSLCEVPMLICADNALSERIPCFTAITKRGMIERLKYLKSRRGLVRDIGKEARKVVLQEFTYRHAAKKFADFFINIIKQNES